ncbi:hypothetical protein ACOMHN_004661 [Nucella lapillus]
MHHNKQDGKPRISPTKMQYPEKVEEFAKSLEDALSAEKWDHLRETIQKTAFVTFGRKTSKNRDWFEAKSSEMTPVALGPIQIVQRGSDHRQRPSDGEMGNSSCTVRQDSAPPVITQGGERCWVSEDGVVVVTFSFFPS